MYRQKLNVRDITVCALFTTLTAVGAFIKIPVPVVPFTLQFLFTTMAGLLLGKRLGALSVAVYVALGLAGLPIFAEGGGLGYLFRPSFGYLIGFCAGAWVTGAIAEKGGRKPGFGRLLAAKLRRPVCGVSVRHGVLLCDRKLCNRFADRNLAAVSLLFSAGCTGGHCPVHTGGGSRQTDYPGSRY